MKILAIDPSSKSCGVFDGVTSETWVFEGTRPQRLAAFAEKLGHRLSWDLDVPFDVVIFETQFHRGNDATRCLVGMAGIIEALATSAGAAVLDVNNSSLKAWARKNGATIAASKDKAGMIRWVAEKFSVTELPSDEADAVALWNYAVEKMVMTSG